MAETGTRHDKEYMSWLAPSMAAEPCAIAVSWLCVWMWGPSGWRTHKSQSIYHLPQGLKRRELFEWLLWPLWMRMLQPCLMAQASALSLALSLSVSRPSPLLSSSPSSAQLPRSGSLRPASPQPAAATVAACLPASLARHLPPFSAFPLLCSPLCSTVDYEIFSSFAAV